MVLDAEAFRGFAGFDFNGVLLNHADQEGLVVQRGLDGLSVLRGMQFPVDTSGLDGVYNGVLEGLLAVTGLESDSGLNVRLCGDLLGAVAGLALRGVRADPADTPSIPYSVGGEYRYYSVVESVTGRYNSTLDCRSMPCIIDGSLATGVRRYPVVEGEFLAFTFLNKWLYTPGGMGAVFYTDGFPGLLECGEPNPLLVAYVRGVLDYLESIGIRGVEDKVLELTGEYGWLLDKAGYTPLTPPEREYRAGIISFSLPLPGGEVDRVKSRLEEQGVRVGFTRKIMRLSPSFYNVVGDIDPVLRLLR